MSALALLLILLWAVIQPNSGEAAPVAEPVEFYGATRPVGALQQRLARERGEEPTGKAAERLLGYLARPEGDGPFAAVVVLHGCDGFRPDLKDSLPERLVPAGMAVLLIDSFATRGTTHSCTPGSLGEGRRQDTAMDAFGALRFLAGLPFIDRNRIGLVGYGQGGWTALLVSEERPFDMFHNPERLKFKATVAYYPWCGTFEGRMAVPTLVLVGEADTQTPAHVCQKMMERRGGAGAPVDLVVLPGAFRSFDNPTLVSGKSLVGHWHEFHPEAASRASRLVDDFLREQLRQ